MSGLKSLPLQQPSSANKRQKLQAQTLQAFAASDDEEEGTAATSDSIPYDLQRQLADLQTAGYEAAEAGELALALEHFDKALSIIGKEARSEKALVQCKTHELYEAKAQILLEQGGKEFEAIKAATRATQLASDWLPGFLTLGRAQREYGEPQLALRSYQRVLQLQPDHPAKDEISEIQMLAILQGRGEGGRRADVQKVEGHEQNPMS